MSHSFISPKFYDMIGWDENDPRRISTTILNPLGEDFSVMRTTVLPSMLDNLAHNHAHRNPTASLYELGTIYTPTVKDGKADPGRSAARGEDPNSRQLRPPVVLPVQGRDRGAAA